MIHVALSEQGAKRHNAWQWLVAAYESYREWQPTGDVQTFVAWLNDNERDLDAALAARSTGGK